MILKKLWANLWLNHKSKGLFFLVWSSNTLFTYLVFVGFDILFTSIFSKRYMAYMSAQVLSDIAGFINGFICHKYITFKSQVRGKSIINEFTRFFFTSVFTMIIAMTLLVVFVQIIGLDPKKARALLIPVIGIMNYIGHSRFSFIR